MEPRSLRFSAKGCEGGNTPKRCGNIMIDLGENIDINIYIYIYTVFTRYCVGETNQRNLTIRETKIRS